MDGYHKMGGGRCWIWAAMTVLLCLILPLSIKAENEKATESLLEDKYSLSATASDQFRSFSMDIYDDEHGPLYLLELGEHNAFCINYGKRSPKGTTYAKKTADDYLTKTQQEVIEQGLMYFLWLSNSKESGNKVWGEATDLVDLDSSTGYYLYMQIWVWAAMKDYDAYECAAIMRDTIISWSSDNISWADGYYRWALQFLDAKLYEKYSVEVTVYSSGISSNQDMFVYDFSTLKLTDSPDPPSPKSSRNKVQIIKNSTDGSRLTDAGFTLYQWNGSTYVEKEKLKHVGNGVYESGIVIECTVSNQGKWKVAETTVPAHHVGDSESYEFNIAEELVKAWFAHFLERSPQALELSTWSDSLKSGKTEYEVMRKFATTSSVNQKSNAVYIQALYVLILKREPTAEQQIYWNTKLTEGSFTRGSMFDYFWIHANHEEGVLMGTKPRIVLEYTMTNTRMGRIQVQKVSANPEVTEDNPNYSLKGAVYGIYSNSTCTKEVSEITTDANGLALSGWLAPGIYYVREKTASNHYTVNPTIVMANVTTNFTVFVVSKETPVLTSIEIEKSSSRETELSLAGAVYGIFRDAHCRDLVTTVTTDAAGHGEVNGLALGTYYIKELEAPKGFGLDLQIYTAYCSGPNPVIIHSVDTPENDMQIRVWKRDDRNLPLAGGTFLLEKYEEETGNWVNPYQAADSESDKQINVLTTDDTGSVVFEKLEAGVYRVTETEAPRGYTLLAEPMEVKLPVRQISQENAGNADYIQDGYDYYLTCEITVQEGQLIQMPFTGGRGNLLFVSGSAGLVMLGSALMMAERDRSYGRRHQ